jgi:hypothetical protein
VSQEQSFTVYRGEDASIVLTGEDNTNPTAYTLVATWSAYDGQDPVTGSTTSVTVGGAGPYTLTISFTRAQTSAMTGNKYRLDLWRTDTGSNIRLAGGTLTVLTPVRLPA